jgi:hypothetical protein
MEAIPVALLNELVMLDPRKNDARIVDALIFWHVGKAADGLTYENLERLCGLCNGSISRNIRRLGTIDRKGNAGYGLLDVGIDPLRRRRYLVKLSIRGQKIYSKYFGAGR